MQTSREICLKKKKKKTEQVCLFVEGMRLKLPTLPLCLQICRCQLLSEPEIEVMALRGLSVMSLGDKRLSLRNHWTAPPAWEWVRLRLPRTEPEHSIRIFPSTHRKAHHVQFCTTMSYFTPWSWHWWARGLQSQPTASLYKDHCGISPSGFIENTCFNCWLRLTEIMLNLPEMWTDSTWW